MLQRKLRGGIREIEDAVDIYDKIADRFKDDKDKQPGEGQDGQGQDGQGQGQPGNPGNPGQGGTPAPSGKYTKQDLEDKFKDMRPDYKPDADELRKSTPVRVGGKQPGSFNPEDNFEELELQGGSPGDVGDIIKTPNGFERVTSVTADGVESTPISNDEVVSIFNDNFKK